MSAEVPPVIEAPATVIPPGGAGGPGGSRPSNTTREQDRHSQGQRNVNLIWEVSQAAIALLVVGTTCLGIFIGRVLQGEVPTEPFPAEWWTILGLVIGFYFGRTNHARIGDDPSRETRQIDSR